MSSPSRLLVPPTSGAGRSAGPAGPLARSSAAHACASGSRSYRGRDAVHSAAGGDAAGGARAGPASLPCLRGSCNGALGLSTTFLHSPSTTPSSRLDTTPMGAHLIYDWGSSPDRDQRESDAKGCGGIFFLGDRGVMTLGIAETPLQRSTLRSVPADLRSVCCCSSFPHRHPLRRPEDDEDLYHWRRSITGTWRDPRPGVGEVG